MPRFFADDLERFGDAPALIASPEGVLSFRELAARSDAFGRALGRERGLLLVEARNEVAAVVAYVGALRARHPVMLVAPDKAEMTRRIVDAYRPARTYRRVGSGWDLHAAPEHVPVHGDLAVLLSTSGSTGSRKFVRLSYENVDANAASIAEYLGIDGAHVAITALPVSYSYGLSVVNSHLARGAAVVLTEASVVDEAFWARVREHGVTSFAGVPHTFELLERVGFASMDLPSLRYFTQAGGRLAADKVERFGKLARARGWTFFVMYGQTEATARIAYVPPDLLLDDPGCIGVPIPGGALSLRDEQGGTVGAPDTPGELIYRGPNVMMGYAQGAEDLAKGRELEELPTGDIACRNRRGLYYLVGRKSRFSKLFGLRINLDDVEKALRERGVHAVVTGDDVRLVAAITEPGSQARARRTIQERFGLPPQAVEVVAVREMPLLASGKYDYGRIRQLAAQGARRRGTGALPPLGEAFGEILGVANVAPGDSFTSLGGDSLAFVQASLEVERRLGHLPRGWPAMPVSALEAVAPTRRRSSLEAAALLRACAIAVIVMGHAHLLSLPGAAHLLLMIAGYNFARFQLQRVAAADGAWPVLSGLSRVVVPTVLIVALHQASKGRFFPNILLLHANFVDPSLDQGFSYWFIEVMVQILVFLFLLLLVPGIRRTAVARPFESSLALVLGAGAAAMIGPLLWNTDPLYDRVPHMKLWVFAIGMCVHFAGERWRRWLASGLVLLLPLLLIDVRDAAVWWTTLGGLVLIWVGEVKAPRHVARLVGWVASGSLYIYLTHYLTFNALRRLVPQEYPLLWAVAGITVGVVAWMVADRLWRLWRLAGGRRDAGAVEDHAGGI